MDFLNSHEFKLKQKVIAMYTVSVAKRQQPNMDCDNAIGTNKIYIIE